MRILLAAVAAAAAFVVFGCTSGQQSLPSITVSGQPPNPLGLSGAPKITGNLGKEKAWVADSGANAIYLCQPGAARTEARREPFPAPTPTGCKYGGPLDEDPLVQPLGLFFLLDEIYLVDSGNQQILEYDTNGKLVRTLSDTGYYPQDVAVSSSGEVAVTNYCGSSSCSGNIAMYAPGATNPTIITGFLKVFISGGFDAKGNFYNDGYTSTSGVGVGIVRNKSKKNEDTGFGTSLSVAGGLKVAHDGTINILDTCSSGTCVKIFDPKGTYHSVLLPGARPGLFSFNAKDSQLWTSSLTDSGYALIVYRYPTGAPMASISGFVGPLGVAVVHEGSP